MAGPTDPGGGPDSSGGVPSQGARRGRVLVLSGPSAVGKSTVVRLLRERLPDLHFSVSATTRAPRPGEVDGVDYSFVSPEQFQRLVDSGELLEWAEIHGGLHRSGTPSGPVLQAAAAGRPVLIEVDLAGARAVKRMLPDAVTVFLAPPDWDALQRRLAERGTETPELMARRLATAEAELAARDEFDVVVVNSRLESACAELVSLLVGNAPKPGASGRGEIAKRPATPT
ncbi:MAG: guanylate kinase [Mycobacteriaceae bacterium]|nr:guanylate kinase [Mycobacterium sp.]NBP84122.1 guanylate kinase [Mycobacteriaceae bacterium]